MARRGTISIIRAREKKLNEDKSGGAKNDSGRDTQDDSGGNDNDEGQNTSINPNIGLTASQNFVMTRAMKAIEDSDAIIDDI